MADEPIDVMVLGGGIAGLGAAWRARELGRTAVVYEARERAGGLLDHFTVNGFRFDQAVHLSFATEPRVRELFDRTPHHTHPSDSRCFETDRWLKHPVQNNLFPLEAADKVALLKSFLARPDAPAGDDCESWLRHQYGNAIAERYPLRYTRKYWDTPAAQLSTAWVGFDKPLVSDLWFCLYDESIWASRGYSPSVKSPDAAPLGCSSLQFEAYSRGLLSRFEPEALKANTVQALRTLGIARPEDIVVLHHCRLPWGNVVFDQGMETHRDAVRGWLADQGVRTCGRFGEWDYLWSHQSLLSGWSAL